MNNEQDTLSFDLSFLQHVITVQCRACGEFLPYNSPLHYAHDCPEQFSISDAYIQSIPPFAFHAYSRGRRTGV